MKKLLLVLPFLLALLAAPALSENLTLRTVYGSMNFPDLTTMTLPVVGEYMVVDKWIDGEYQNVTLNSGDDYIIIEQDGVYLVTVSISMTSNFRDYYNMAVFLNDNRIEESTMSTLVDAPGVPEIFSYSFQKRLYADDVLDVRVMDKDNDYTEVFFQSKNFGVLRIGEEFLIDYEPLNTTIILNNTVVYNNTLWYNNTIYGNVSQVYVDFTPEVYNFLWTLIAIIMTLLTFYALVNIESPYRVIMPILTIIYTAGTELAFMLVINVIILVIMFIDMFMVKNEE